MLTIDHFSPLPIYEQVVRQMELYIALGTYPPGSQLPSVRNLSLQLSINPNTLQKAYAELERRGLCHSVPGNGRFISLDALDRLRQHSLQRLSTLAELARELHATGVTLDEMTGCIHAAINGEEGKKA